MSEIELAIVALLLPLASAIFTPTFRVLAGKRFAHLPSILTY